MARTAGGWTIYDKRGWKYVYFRWKGRPFQLALHTRDPREAQEKASREYADVISGKRRPVARRAGPALGLEELLARWIDVKRPTVHPKFALTLETYAGHFVETFGSLDRITEATIGDWLHMRLGGVVRSTVLRERAYLLQFLEWCRVHGVIDVTPTVPKLPPKARGTRTGKQRAKPVHLSPEEAEALIERLPQESKTIGGRKWPLRERYRFMWLTGFRPNTLSRLRVPDNWKPGQKHVELADADDKARFGRTVDLSAAALAVLRKVAPEAGLIFGDHSFYKAWKQAAIEVLGQERGEKCAPYDLRHGRAKAWLDRGAKIRGVGYQLGHKRASTTDKYLSPDRAAGAEVLRVTEGRERVPFVYPPPRKRKKPG